MRKIFLCIFILGLISFIKSQETGFWIDKKYLKETTFFQLTTNDCKKPKFLLGSSYDQTGWKASKKMNSVLMKLYTATSKTSFSLNDASVGITSSTDFVPTSPTIIIIHGYGGDAESPNVVQLANTLKGLGSRNVITLDHSILTRTPNYYFASTMVQYVGEKLGSVLADMHNRGATSFHLIGHSLGAHMAGFAGKVYKSLTGVSLDRISGLDAAGPCFSIEPTNKRLTSTDATFVDVIHTDVRAFGTDAVSGHVDFYPNSGINMPGCYIILCSHVRAFNYYIESVTNDNFLSRTCSSYTNFLNGQCTSNPTVHMGYWLSTTTPSGSYYLKTASNSNYALGSGGVF